MAAENEMIIKLVADVDGAKKDLENIKKEVTGIGDASKKTAEATGGIKKGIKGVGLAMKAAGIGLALKAFELLSEAFSKNQTVADLFSTSFEVLSIMINDFVTFVVNNFGTVTDFFKDVFENPVEKIKDFGDSIKENLIERFNSFLETMGFVGEAISELFAGNFSAAKEAAKNAGKELVDVATGVDGAFDKITETVENVTKKVVDYTKKTIEAASANIELRNASELAQAQIKGLIESYDRQAEKLRQVRDDENATFADRIKANEELGEVLKKQGEEMKTLQELTVASAQADFDKLQNNENLIALTEAKNELLAIEAQITGFQSEQLTNQVSLENELGQIKRDLALESMDTREQELAAVNQYYDELFKLAKKSGTDTTQLEKQKAKAIQKVKQEQLSADLQMASNALGNMKEIFGEESAAGKAAAIAQATINTYQGVTAALASAPPPINLGLAAISLAQGLKAVKEITATPEPKFAAGGIVRGMGTGTSDSISAKLSKGETVINARSTRMFKPLLSALNEAGGGVGFADGGTLDTSVGGQTFGAIKAFVVTDDITDSQDSLEKIRQKATI